MAVSLETWPNNKCAPGLFVYCFNLTSSAQALFLNLYPRVHVRLLQETLWEHKLRASFWVWLLFLWSCSQFVMSSTSSSAVRMIQAQPPHLPSWPPTLWLGYARAKHVSTFAPSPHHCWTSAEIIRSVSSISRCCLPEVIIPGGNFFGMEKQPSALSQASEWRTDLCSTYEGKKYWTGLNTKQWCHLCSWTVYTLSSGTNDK